jgi:hypothetical protein
MCQSILSDDLCMCNLSEKSVSLLLHDYKSKHTECVSQSLFLYQTPFPTIITGDDFWIYLYDLERSSSWPCASQFTASKKKHGGCDHMSESSVGIFLWDLVHHEDLQRVNLTVPRITAVLGLFNTLTHSQSVSHTLCSGASKFTWETGTWLLQ